MRVKYYVRYMDDFVIWDNSKARLREILRDVRTFLDQRLTLQLKENVLLWPANCGMNFLGYRIFSHKLHLTRRNKKRFISTVRKNETQFQKGLMTEDDLSRRVSSLLGFVSHADTLGLRMNLFIDNGHIIDVF